MLLHGKRDGSTFKRDFVCVCVCVCACVRVCVSTKIWQQKKLLVDSSKSKRFLVKKI